MSDVMRWRYGDTNPVVLPVAAGTVIEIGDLLYWDTDEVLPAGDQADAGSEAANLAAFHTAFAGVAMQRSRSGDTTPIRVATTGVFEFELKVAATAEVGALIGTVLGSGALLADQQVAGVAALNKSIGRCAKRLSTAGTRILVDIVSVLTLGGPQAAA